MQLRQHYGITAIGPHAVFQLIRRVFQCGVPDRLLFKLAAAAVLDAVIDEILKRSSALALISDEGMETRADVPWHFQCQTGTNGPQFNHSTVLALCHQIMLRTSAAAGPAGRAGLRRAEEINERIGALWQGVVQAKGAPGPVDASCSRSERP